MSDLSDLNPIVEGINRMRRDDIIIAFMGPIGSGRSTFIDLLTGQKGQRAGHGLQSHTSGIEATRINNHPKYGKRVVLVDTPGFDDTTKTDMEILTLVNDWLEKTYENDVRLSGLVYLHRITDNRMGGSPVKNLRMFANLCGDHALSRVILVSTMWGKVDLKVGERREDELKQEFWKSLLEKGSSVDRLGSSATQEAWRIVDKLIETADQREALLLQQEIVDLQKSLNETEAGKVTHSDLQKLLYEQRESVKSLLAQVEKINDPKLTANLKREYKQIKNQFEQTFKEAKKTRVSIGRRIMLLFSFRRPHPGAIKVVKMRV